MKGQFTAEKTEKRIPILPTQCITEYVRPFNWTHYLSRMIDLRAEDNGPVDLAYKDYLMKGFNSLVGQDKVLIYKDRS